MIRTIALTLCMGLVWAGAPKAEHVMLHYGDERDARSIAASIENGIVYAGVRDLADALGVEAHWLSESQKMVIGTGLAHAKITAWNPVAVADEIPYNMPGPAVIRGGTLLAPAAELARLLSDYSPSQLVWDDARRAFRLEVATMNVVPGTVDVRDNGTMLTLRVDGDLPIEERTSSPSWLHLTFLGGRIDTRSFSQLPTRGALLQIIPSQYQNSAELSLRLARNHTYELHHYESTGFMMVLIRPQRALPEPLTDLEEMVEIDRDKWAINTIVIDPGHGGRDPGAVGWDDIYEKDITLPIALRLAERLRSGLGVDVVLTRDTDRFVSLRSRGRTALQNNGKLFISIHCNSLPAARWVSGVQTYFLSEAQTEEARRVAQLENAALQYEVDDEMADMAGEDCCNWEDVDEILVGMTSDYYLRESQDLAKAVQEEMVRSLGVRDLGVLQANFYVMRGTLAAMPSVLVEVGYLSNPAEARKLRRRSWQRRVADAIYRAVQEFKLAHEQDM